MPDKQAKQIEINWPWRTIDKAILVDHRAPQTFEDTVRAVFEPDEIRSLLKSGGMNRTFIGRTMRGLYHSDCCQNATHNNYSESLGTFAGVGGTIEHN